MVEVSVAGSIPSSGLTGVSAGPSQSDARTFSDLMAPSNIVSDGLKSFVQNVQTKMEMTDKRMSSKLDGYELNNRVFSLIDTMHESSLRSVTVQLSGKIGSKVSESFEQLIKQQ
jgi:hypothetical protein